MKIVLRGFGIRTNIVLAVVAFLATAEVSARLYLRKCYHGRDPREFYYPKLGAMKSEPFHGDTLTLGILGCSVTATELIPRCIREKVEAISGRPVNVFDLSYIGGTMGDALYLYKWLETQKFHTVIVHQGIGDLRLNVHFREVSDDYANLTWFKRRQDVDRYFNPLFQLPCALAYLWTNHLEKQNTLNKDWNQRTDKGFPTTDSSRNVGIVAFTQAYQRVLDIAKERNEAIISVSNSYSDIHGEPGQKRLVTEYNDTIRNMTERNGSHFIDISSLTNQPGLYEDFSHFNLAGQERMCECIVQGVVESGILKSIAASSP